MKPEWTQNLSVPFLSLLVIGCTPYHFGSYPEGAARFPDQPVSVIEAVEKAEPYLDESFRLRQKGRDQYDWPTWDPTLTVTLKGGYYYIVKDNYPYIYHSAYRAHAVKVHSKTGKLIPPK